MMDKLQYFIIGVVLGILAGGLAGRLGMKQTLHRQAIEHGAAHYDKATGEWEWDKKDKP